MMKSISENVLLVDDSRSLSQYLQQRIQEVTGVNVICANSMAQAQQLLTEHPAHFLVAILDLNLPDAPNGEIIAEFKHTDIPVIVLTGYLSEQLREQLLTQSHIIDYVIKNNPSEIGYIANLVRRIHRNHQIKILIVDDSRSFRLYLQELLHTHCYLTVDAANGEEALQQLNAHRDIRLVLTDFHMPKMNGQELITAIRRQHDRNQLAIIGISDQASPVTSVKLLKAGANDFIAKPFLTEEFFCRITQNIETLEFIDFFRDSAIRDFLTQLHNRRYLFEAGMAHYQKADRGEIKLALALIDIDFFKKVNDTHGHLAGDQVLKKVAQALHQQMQEQDILVRYGGEEFCLLLPGDTLTEAKLMARLNALREAVAALQVPHLDGVLKVTISIGATFKLCESLSAMIDVADAALYQAKESGRNCVHLG